MPDGERGGKPFEHFFKVTRADLLSAGIYRPLAIPWYHRSSYRAISISTVAIHALKAKKQQAWWGYKREAKQEEAQVTSEPKRVGQRVGVRSRRLPVGSETPISQRLPTPESRRLPVEEKDIGV